jgi:carbon dioxide concentrating mechanism protein CcmN
MHLPPLQPPIAAGYCVSGAVVIAPDAIVAPGVVLMADPNSQITIASAVCLGLGVILHANGGRIAIEMGATLGAGVLIVGSAVIGRGATIGPSSTIYNSSVASYQLVPPGSLLGERELGERELGEREIGGPEKATTADPWSDAVVDPVRSHPGSASTGSTATDATQAAPPSPEPVRPPKAPGVVYGKDAFLQMRGAMFPT